MNKINLMFLLVQVTLTSYVTGQKPMCSRKVVFVDGTYNASLYANQSVSFPTYNPSTKAEVTSLFAIHNPDAYDGYKYTGPFSYNPMPFDIAKEGNLAFLSMFSMDNVSSNFTLRTASKIDRTKLLSDSNHTYRSISSGDTPLSSRILFDNPNDALLFFDLAMASKDELRFYISTESNNGLEIWTFDLRQEVQINQSPIEVSGYRKYWVLKHTVSMDLNNPFSAFIINGKDYIINESGEFYSVDNELVLLEKLPGNLSHSAIILDKDRNEVYYIPNCYKSSRKLTLRDIVKQKKIKLEIK